MECLGTPCTCRCIEPFSPGAAVRRPGWVWWGGDDLPRGLDGPGSWRAPSRASRILLGPCGGVAHRRGASPRTDSGFSARFRGFPGTSVFSGWAPMCRGARSAHGRISTTLSTEAFPHDSADPPPTDPDRMCSTTRVAPIPHIRAWRHRPNTPDPTPTSPRPLAPFPAGPGIFPVRKTH